MKVFDGLLGLAVLTSPLWLILILLPVSIWIAVKVARRFKRTSVRFVGGIGIFLLVFLAPFVDEIVGRMYFDHLCATEAGVKVYRTMELPDEYWDDEGRPRLKAFRSNTPGIINLVGIRKPIFQQIGFTKPYSKSFHIDSTGFRLQEISSGKVFGEINYYRYWGGWLARNFTTHNSAISCDIKNLDEWKYSIFLRSESE